MVSVGDQSGQRSHGPKPTYGGRFLRLRRRLRLKRFPCQTSWSWFTNQVKSELTHWGEASKKIKMHKTNKNASKKIKKEQKNINASKKI